MTLVTLVTRNSQDWKMEKESAQYWIDDDVVLCFGHPSAFSCSVSAPFDPFRHVSCHHRSTRQARSTRSQSWISPDCAVIQGGALPPTKSSLDLCTRWVCTGHTSTKLSQRCSKVNR